MLTEENICLFNKACCEFVKDMKYVLYKPNADFEKFPKLKHMYKVDTSDFDYPLNSDLLNKINAFEFCDGYIKYMTDFKNCKFHCDWNWIIKLIEVIKEKTGVKLEIVIDKEEMTKTIYNFLKHHKDT